MAVKINDEMPLHTFNRLLSLLDNSLTEKNILVCGISYRQDIGDTRYSPSEKLVKALLDQGAKVTCHDPYIEFWEEMNQDLPEQLPLGSKYDAIIMAVPHKEYKMLDIAQWADGCGVILDANMVLSYDQRKIARESGIRVESIGRADGL